MEKSRLVYVLMAFSAREMRQFGKFVESPFFNESSALVELLKYLHQCYPDFSSERIALPMVWQQLFGDEVFKEIKLRQLMSKLLSLAEQFLAYQQWQHNPIQAQIATTMALQDRALPKLFWSSWTAAENTNEEQPLRSVGYHQNRCTLAQIKHHYIEQQEQRDIEPELQAVSDSLDTLFILQKLKFFCKMHNYQLISHKPYRYELQDAIVEYAKVQNFEQQPAIVAYYFALMTIRNKEENAHFFALKNILQQQHHLFSPEELQDLFVLARNFCIRRANVGERDFAHELLDLYKTEIDQETILQNGYISPATYKNIVTLAIALKEMEWVVGFVEQLKQHLRPEHREEVYALNLARILFSQKNYAPILPLLQQVHYRDTLFELSAKTLLLQTYFELGEYQVLLSFLDSFSVFLQRKTSVSNLRKHYQNLIKYVKKWVSIPDYDKAARQQLWEEIEQLSNVAERAWLLNKVRP
ncbi:MAG: hypothetical protein JNM36_15305 [Chitinophagales bacterium]|nr:hypothetical protein [Chitinophagales bacterium]HNI43684.1 hypothetical protein [Chitinophagales bacterium]